MRSSSLMHLHIQISQSKPKQVPFDACELLFSADGVPEVFARATHATIAVLPRFKGKPMRFCIVAQKIKGTLNGL